MSLFAHIPIVNGSARKNAASLGWGWRRSLAFDVEIHPAGFRVRLRNQELLRSWRQRQPPRGYERCAAVLECWVRAWNRVRPPPINDYISVGCFRIKFANARIESFPNPIRVSANVGLKTA